MSHFIPEPMNVSEVTRLSAEVRKAWLKENLKDVKNIIHNQKFIMNNPWKGEPVTHAWMSTRQTFNIMEVLTI